jgi:hypothetical protein
MVDGPFRNPSLDNPGFVRTTSGPIRSLLGMKVITTILVAVGILWVEDALMNDGEYTAVLLMALKSGARSIGLPI